MSARRSLLVAILLCAACVVFASGATTDVGLLVYPANYTVFRYEAASYEIKEPADPQYDPAYSVSGHMLWNRTENRVALEVYRAFGLTGFEVSATGRNEFFMMGNTAAVCVDGFSAYPRQLNDIYIEFQPFPPTSSLEILVDDVPVQGLRYYIPRLVVSTPTGDGFYADAAAFRVRWVGAEYLRIFVYADKNGNRVFDGEPFCSLLMQDLTVPTEERSWGAIKSLYGDR
jgi:hypothetical protein